MPRHAKGRMLWRTISVSDRVNELNLKAALLYTWMIAHADDQGRLTGDPKKIKKIIVPFRDEITEDEIPEMLEGMGDSYLIDLYNAKATAKYPFGGGKVIQIRDWWTYQSLFDPQDSRYPPSPEWTKDRVGRQTRDTFGRFNKDRRKPESASEDE
jgi:hypothetical protein